MKKVQDWEYARETTPDEWETVDIQIDTEAQATTEAQRYANEHNCRCVVSTSFRYEENGHVEDRGLVPDSQPVILTPVS